VTGKFDRYRQVVNGIEVHRTWCECRAPLLDEPIPQEELNALHGVNEDGEPNVTGVTLRDFTLSAQEFGDTAIITLGAQFAKCYRTRPVNEKDLEDWEMYLSAYGYDSSKWMNEDEYKARLLELMPHGDN
jgi:hypothetical protein